VVEPLPEKDDAAVRSTDTFGDSLRHVNKIYNAVFGKTDTPDRRRVPSHMPHFIQKKLLSEMKAQWPVEFNATSSHRFRHPKDMQFSFSYMYYVANRHKLHPPTLEEIFTKYIDLNLDGVIDDNEVLSVASLLTTEEHPSESDMEEVKKCLTPPSVDRIIVQNEERRDGKVTVTESTQPYKTFESLKACTNVSTRLIETFQKRRPPRHRFVSEAEVTFHMLSDQYRTAWNQLLNTRARKTKFVCINDDMKYPSHAVSNILHDLFTSLWPDRSQFELPFHLTNKFGHINKIAATRMWQWKLMLGGIVAIIIIYMILMCCFNNTLSSPAHFSLMVTSKKIGPAMPDIAAAKPRFRSLKELCGIVYMLMSVLLGVYNLVLLYPYLDNNYIWYGYSSANVFPALMSIYNMKLNVFTNDSTFNLLDSSSITLNDKIGCSSAYPRLIMYQELTTLESAVIGLRNIALPSIAYMVTQYCWVDFERRWAMAHTVQRQERCLKKYTSNSAVYMETIFRNIDFTEWVNSTQGLFYIRIAAGLLEFPDGHSFLNYLIKHELFSVNDEVAYLKSHGLQAFVLQYSNQYQIGIHDTIQIENAMGLSWPLPIKTIESWHRGLLFSTKTMFSGLQFDWAVLSGNMSMIQNSSNFFGLIDTNLIEEYNTMSPLTLQFAAVHNQLGSLVSIDLHLIPPLVELLEAVKQYHLIIQAFIKTNKAFADAIIKMENYDLHPTPLKWQNQSLVFYGGNPMCGFGAPLPFIQESFGFDDVCATQNVLTVSISAYNAVFAYLILNKQPTTVCQLVAANDQVNCQKMLLSVKSIANMLPEFKPVEAMKQANNMQLGYVQLVSVNGTNNISLESQPILSSDFAFFGWAVIYDWACNQREAVSFEGDNATYAIMSYIAKAQPPPQIDLLQCMAIYTWYCCVIVSIGLCGVACLLLVIWFMYQPLGCPWFMFNRVVGGIWLNRSLLVLRGFAAIVCMSSATVLPVEGGNGIYFTNTPRSILESCIFASEATWITYVLHETFYPLTTTTTAQYASISSCISWLVLAILDIFFPVQINTSLERSCFSKNMDQMVYCSSGTVSIGSWLRTSNLFIALVISVPLCYFIDKYTRGTNMPMLSTPSFVIPAAAIAFLNPNQIHKKAESRVDCVTSAMMGTIAIEIFNRQFIFDTKLWYMLPTEVFQLNVPRIYLPHCFHTNLTKQSISLRAPSYSSMVVVENRRKRFIVLAGFFYALASLSSNIAYFKMAQEFLMNDFGWAGFNTTGLHAYLGNVMNRLLLINTSQSLDFSESRLIEVDQLYNYSVSSIAMSFNAPRRQLYQPVPLASIVQGLRAMDPCMLPWMFTQYCFLDFQRRWAMSRTIKRQLRCEAKMSNGALYLEAPLRNVNNWDTWTHCWGTSFEIGIATYLRTTSQGQEWFKSISNNRNSIEQEVNLWLQYNITKFQLQWQNYKTTGIADSIKITSALGFSSFLTISKLTGSFHPLQQTSLRMYWSFASDLWAISNNDTVIGGLSLITSSPVYAFTNDSSTFLLYQNLTLPNPLTAGLKLLQSLVGPFNAIDMIYVLPPLELLAMYNAFVHSINDLLRRDSKAQQKYFEIPPKTGSCPVPPFLLSDPNIMSNGGNIMCGDDVPPEPAFIGLLTGFGSATVCHAEFLEVLKISTIELLFILHGYITTLENASLIDINGLCSLDVCAGVSCGEHFNISYQFLHHYSDVFSSLKNSTNIAANVVYGLNIQVIQYYQVPNDSSTYLYQINVLEPSEPLWNFYGWALLYEWICGLREVVQFLGDSGAITSISYDNLPISMTPDPTEIPHSFSSIFSGCTFYVSWMLVGVVGLTSLCCIFDRGHVEGWNLFEMNRIIGNVWAGRTFLIMRSITALWILNTAPLKLIVEGHLTYITSPQLPWFKTILAASEVTWFVYVLNDVFSVITKEYTKSYASKSSMTTWSSVAALTIISPRYYSASLNRECSYVDMDFSLVCVSGEIIIGSLSGINMMLLIASVYVVICYLLERLLFPQEEQLKFNSVLLNAQARYMLEFSKCKFDSERLSSVLIIFDIKSWRFISVPIDDSKQWNRSIPLSRI
ncbi:N-acetylglucosamine-1-phosphotransferase subunits alpha/beta, partial [Thraustotheca clavata]